MTAAAAGRYQSLDVLRGLTVALMIVVNTPGSWSHVYAPLLHAPWHGFTPTDWVFPTFLFVVGNALAFTLPRYESMGHRAVLAKIGKRTAAIVALGLLLCLLPKLGGSLGEVRLPGVLQRIGLCFGIAALVLHYLGERGALVFSVAALLGHWLVLALFGDFSLEGNIGRAIDLAVFGPGHLYKGEGIPFDPEGLLGTVPATVNVIGGYFAGRYLRDKGATARTLGVLAVAGAALSVLALVLRSIRQEYAVHLHAVAARGRGDEQDRQLRSAGSHAGLDRQSQGRFAGIRAAVHARLLAGRVLAGQAEDLHQGVVFWNSMRLFSYFHLA